MRWRAELCQHYDYMSRNIAMASSSGALDAVKALRARFESQPVAELKELSQTLKASTRTVFRVLKKVGYHSSFSHAGRYYTLTGIPRFDEAGLWFHGDVGFSAFGTLRSTLEQMIKRAPAGKTHQELQPVVKLRVHDTLRDLVDERCITRDAIEALYIYLDAVPSVARAQLARRRKLMTSPVSPPQLSAPLVIEVLLGVIRHPRATARQLASELRARGFALEDLQVEEVFARHELGKKRALSRSRRWRR